MYSKPLVFLHFVEKHVHFSNNVVMRLNTVKGVQPIFTNLGYTTDFEFYNGSL